MSKIYHTITTPLLLISIFLCSCSATNSLTISVTEPAPVYISPNINTIGIINRSLPTNKKSERLDKLDRILSLEGKNLDKDGAQASILGLFEELSSNDRFFEVKIIDSINVQSQGVGLLPSALSWESIEEICYDNNIDALFALSFYDTDANIKYDATPVKINGPLGIIIPALEHHASIGTIIKTGWRIYDPINKLVLDEYLINEKIVTVGKGTNPVKAVEALKGRKEAVLHMSNNIGHNYAFRILPYNIRVSRNYFVRGSNNFKIAKRRAQTGDWDGAAELWNKEVTNSKRKIAGRAYYNMAIINEINNDLNSAVDWASKSYTDFNNKDALRYLNILKYRIDKNQQLQQELN